MNRDIKRARPYDEGTCKGMLKIKDKPMFKKRVSNQDPLNMSKYCKDRVSNITY